MLVSLYNPLGPEGRPYIKEGRCEQRLSSFGYRMLPVSLPSIAGMLRERGHEVEIVDATTLDSTANQSLPNSAADLVIVNVSTPTFSQDVETIEHLRTETRAHLTAIGVHVTAKAEPSLRESRLDSVVRGEPEWTIAELADVLSGNGRLHEVAGLSYRSGDEIVHNEDRPFGENLNQLPVPARDLVEEASYYLSLPKRPYTLVVPSRGCPHSCTYCTAHLYYGKKHRTRDPSAVVDEIEEIYERGVVRDFVMWSDLFTLDKAHVLGISEELIRRNLDLQWMCNSRVDTFDREMAEAMKASGCSGISFGVESGDARILDKMKKGTTPDQGRAAFALAREVGIPTLAQFILGIPGETPGSIRTTINYAKEIDPDFAQFYCATPMPGTELAAEVEREGYLVDHDPSNLEFNQAVISTPWLDAATLRRMRKTAYREFYFRPHVVRRLLPLFRGSTLGSFVDEARGFLKDWVLDG